MGRVTGKVALITGAGRGQGRSHAVRLAEEGADILATDICQDLPFSMAPHATWDDLEETGRLVEKAGGRVVLRQVDVRDRSQLDDAVAAGVEAFGKVDVVVANAASVNFIGVRDLTVEQFEATLEVNLHGVRNTVKAALPQMVGRQDGGSIILISSGVAYKSVPVADYVAAKTALIGLARALATELAGDWIRVNTIHPGQVLTPILDNEPYQGRLARQYRDGEPFSSHQEFLDFMWEKYTPRHMLPVGWLDPVDISQAVLYLASDESRYVTAEEIRVDGGYAERGAQ